MRIYWQANLIRGPVVTGRAVGRVRQVVVTVARAAQEAVAACVQVTVRVRVLVVAGEVAHPRVLVAVQAAVQVHVVAAALAVALAPVAVTAVLVVAALRSGNGDFIKIGA